MRKKYRRDELEKVLQEAVSSCSRASRIVDSDWAVVNDDMQVLVSKLAYAVEMLKTEMMIANDIGKVKSDASKRTVL